MVCFVSFLQAYSEGTSLPCYLFRPLIRSSPLNFSPNKLVLHLLTIIYVTFQTPLNHFASKLAGQHPPSHPIFKPSLLAAPQAKKAMAAAAAAAAAAPEAALPPPEELPLPLLEPAFSPFKVQ